MITAEIHWASIAPAVGLAITAVGTACVGLWRYYELTRLEIRLKEHEIEEWRPPSHPTP